MRIRRRHLLHSAVSIAVVVQLGFATAFLVDAAQTNRTYDTLVSHRVGVNGRVQTCLVAGPQRGGYRVRMCRIDYRYNGIDFSALLSSKRSTTYYVDPKDTSVRMSKVAFDGGPEETTVDLVLAGVLLLGATAMTTIHMVHLRRRRTRSRL